MHKVTERFFQLAWSLDQAGLRGYWSNPEPEFAILMSFEEARELYFDILKSDPSTAYMFTDPSSPLNWERKQIFCPGLLHPPYPDGKRVVWCEIEGIKIAIKGREDA